MTFFLLVCGTLPAGVSGPPRPVTAVAPDEQPDPRKARALDRWPDDTDLARLRSVEGRPGWEVLRALGHPEAVRRFPGGAEVWAYPWPASCQVWLKDGVCTATFCTAGF